MRSHHHVCQSVEGALKNWKSREWKSVAASNDMTIAEVKQFFKNQSALGRRVIPIGEPCAGFSFESGCPGHPEELESRKVDGGEG